MKKLLILILFFIVGYMVAQPPCGNSCTTCPGILTCVSCNCEARLPIELLSFTATTDPNKNIKLSWITATETNNAYFIVEKSINCETFTEIGKIPGAGNSNVLQSYKLIDYNPFWGVAYYRLIQYDYDGKCSYSNIVATELKDNKLVKIEAYDFKGAKISLLETDKIYIIYNYYEDGSVEVEKIKKL